MARTLIPHTTPGAWPAAISGARFASTISTDSADGCDIAIIGLADDLGVRLNGGRTGASEGPDEVRTALASFGVSDPCDPAWPWVFDAGNIVPERGDTEASINATHARVTEAVDAILDLGLFPVAIGGGHDLSFPFVRAVAARGTSLAGVYADAHLDVREAVGSGMPFRKLIDECGCGPIANYGLLDVVNAAAHVNWFRSHRGIMGGFDGVTFTPPLPVTPFFASFDLDVIDAAFAPGVSAINPCGWTPRQAGAFVAAVASSPYIKCFDIMEICPRHDSGGRTARLAAYLFLTFLRSFRRPMTP